MVNGIVFLGLIYSFSDLMNFIIFDITVFLMVNLVFGFIIPFYVL